VSTTSHHHARHVPPPAVLSSADREQLILDHLPEVNKIARHIHRRVPETVSLDDLISIGVVGLITAIDRFDPNRDATLKTYAGHRIPGAILDGLRELDWAPRQRRQRAKQIDAATCAAGQSLQRSPSQEEIAQQLGMSMEQYHRRVAAVNGLSLDSLECESLDDDDQRNLLSTLAGDEDQWPSKVVERDELLRVMAEEISLMPHMEKIVLQRYYYGEMTLMSIARSVGLAESRISQIKTQAIQNLRVRMEKRWPTGRRS